MREIRINFVDFWFNFDKTNNYFYNLLSQKYVVVIDDNPQLLFYSCFSNYHVQYNCKRIFYAGENVKPDFWACDFAFTFDYNNHKNHFRLPLYSLYIDHHNMLDQLQTIDTREEAIKIWRSKTKFCCMVVSNPNCPERIAFFHELSKVKHVDSGGSVLNNVGGPVADKGDFIKDYKFVLSFENSSLEGYTTEKILEPIFKDCIPIYWGNTLVHQDFNAKRFLDYNSFETEQALIDAILEIDQNEELAIDMLLQPTFNSNKVTHEEERARVLDILDKILEDKTKPIAQQFRGYYHQLKWLCYKIKIKLTT